MTQDNSAQFIKEHGEIMAAGEAAKRAADAKTAQDIARLKENDVQTQEILQELVKRILALEQPHLKQKRPMGRVPKAIKKKRQGRRPGSQPEHS
jgi:hypothetical protein